MTTSPAHVATLAKLASLALVKLADELEQHGALDAMARNQGSSLRSVSETRREAAEALRTLARALPELEMERVRANSFATILEDEQLRPKPEMVRKWAAHWSAYALRTDPGEQKPGLDLEWIEERAAKLWAWTEEPMPRCRMSAEAFEDIKRGGDLAGVVSKDVSALCAAIRERDARIEAQAGDLWAKDHEIASLRALLEPARLALANLDAAIRGQRPVTNDLRLAKALRAALATIDGEDRREPNPFGSF